MPTMEIPKEKRLMDHNGGGIGILTSDRIAKRALKMATKAMNFVPAMLL
jgi:acyl-CoA synthetase (NDP forming)